MFLKMWLVRRSHSWVFGSSVPSWLYFKMCRISGMWTNDGLLI